MSEWPIQDSDISYRKHLESRLNGLRVNRYSWWTHARELADYLLPRRYKWLITPNQLQRGSPLNQHILDSTGTLCARNLSSGMMHGISSPTRPWFKLKIGRVDSTLTSPTSLWLAECERLLMLIFQESNFYNAIAVFYFDLVVFGTGVILMYEDFDDVVRCQNPCFGEYFLDNDGKMRPNIFAREFTLTVQQVVDEFGLENCSTQIKTLYNEGKGLNGTSLTREIIIGHMIEPNTGDNFGVPKHFPFREAYWEFGGTQGPQQGTSAQGLLRKRGFYENPAIAVRWDLVSNDAYGRSPGMDALPDIKQLQLETRRKAQAVDKVVNPPMVADIQLKNQPASLLPGGMTYVAGMMANNNPGFASAYGNWRPDIKAMTEDLAEVRERIKRTFFNDLFQTISQYETRSNVSATEIDARRAESLVMLGPVLERIIHEGANNWVERAFAVAARAGIFPPAPAEIAGRNIDIEFVSILATAQNAAATGGIERILGMAGQLAGIDPAVMDNIDIDFAFDKYSSLLNNDPRMIRSPAQLKAIRANREKQQAAAQQAEMAEKLAAGAKTLSETQVGGGKNALQQMTGVG